MRGHALTGLSERTDEVSLRVCHLYPNATEAPREMSISYPGSAGVGVALLISWGGVGAVPPRLQLSRGIVIEYRGLGLGGGEPQPGDQAVAANDSAELFPRETSVSAVVLARTCPQSNYLQTKKTKEFRKARRRPVGGDGLGGPSPTRRHTPGLRL